jgi:hypothetical protein
VAPQFANCTKNPDHPQCGGNGGDGFDGGNVITEFVTGAISGGPYQTIKKRSALSSTLKANKHDLQISEIANESICVSFPDPGAIKDPGLWSDFLAMSGAVPGGAPWCTNTITHHTRDNTNLLTMADGEGRITGGKLVLKEFDTPGALDWVWRLIYDDAKTYENASGDVIGESEWLALGQPASYTKRTNDTGVCVAYDDASQTWTLGTDPTIHSDCAGVVDDQVNLFHLVDGVGFVWVATFTMPFRATVTP